MGKSLETKARGLLSAALAVLLAASTLVTALVSSRPDSAYAAESVNLTIGSDIFYGGFATTWMWVDGQMAYCANPSAFTPSAGSYAKSSLAALSGRTAETIADLWFGYGSPGFDASLWPSTWYDGTEMNAGRYAALTHVLVSDTYSSDSAYALYGCDASFKSWCRSEVLGFDAEGNLINENATGRLIAARQGDVPGNFHAFQLYTGPQTQLILSFAYDPYGSIALEKSSSSDELSVGNPCYSLEGAEYSVYADADLSQLAGVIVTDEAGAGRLDDLAPGMYYVTETASPQGYAPDPEVYVVEVKADETSHVGGSRGVQDAPKANPVTMIAMKVDAEALEDGPQGSAVLEGAEFTVSFYAGSYSTCEEAEASGAPERTWVFKTDESGCAHYSDDCKLSGPALYRASTGEYALPLGTVVIQETKAPIGYNLDDGSGGSPEKFCIQIDDEGAGETVRTYNAASIPNSVKRGDYRLVKEVPVEVEADSGIAQESLRVLVPGVQFQLVNSSENAIVSPEDGRLVDPGDVVCTMTADENGLASTRNGAAVNGWDIPSGWTGALAYGTYTVREVIPESVADDFKAKYRKDLIAVPDWKVSISEEGQYDAPALVNNRIPQTPLKVVKVDAETGKQIPLACSFKLLDAAGEVVTYESHYPDASVMDTWTTNASGEVTLPMLLEQGAYQIVEVEAPEGYALAAEGKAFEVGAVYNGWDNPVVVEFENAPQKATISIIKHDKATGDAVGGSAYIVKAASDVVTPEGTVRAEGGEIVATLVTDEGGAATSPELYLGTYVIYEAKATDGFALDVEEETVTLEYKGQEVSLYDEEVEVTNVPTKLSIKKVDATDAGKPVCGAKFRLWDDAGTFDEEYVTDEQGAIGIPYLKHGTYHLQEVEAPEGYVICELDEEGNALVYDLTVNDQGMFEAEDGSMSAELALTIANMPKTLHTTATDASSGSHEGQARGELTIIDVVEYTGTVPGNEYTVKGTLMDKETGEPARDSDGNEIVAETSFVADGFEGSVEVTFTFNGADLAGTALVAFESMEHEGREYMVHADINDVSQTVNVVDIHTTASNPETGDNTAAPASELRLVDTVDYVGLTPGSSYVMCGHVYVAQTGELLLDADGTAYTCIRGFSPEEPSGSVAMEFTIDASGLSGQTIVFAETLVNAEGDVIATHADLSDEGQSIHFAEDEVEDVPPGKSYPKTGAVAAAATAGAGACALLAYGLAGGAGALVKRRGKRGVGSVPADDLQS